MSQNFEDPMLIAFDGPSASGKSSIAKTIAEHYGLPYLNTGKIYRFIAFKLSEKYPEKNLLELKNLEQIFIEDLEEICLDLIKILKETNELQNLSFFGEKIESEECGQLASKISKSFKIRQELESLQREFAHKNPKGAVLEGRDIGSLIIPEANFKIFITADIDVRTLRRFNQLSSRNQNECLDLTQIKQMILKRDIEDSSREYAPLVLMPDAFLLDTSELNFDSTIEEIKKYIEFKKIMIAALKKSNFNQENYEEIYFEDNNQNNKN